MVLILFSIFTDDKVLSMIFDLWILWIMSISEVCELADMHSAIQMKGIDVKVNSNLDISKEENFALILDSSRRSVFMFMDCSSYELFLRCFGF